MQVNLFIESWVGGRILKHVRANRLQEALGVTDSKLQAVIKVKKSALLKVDELTKQLGQLEKVLLRHVCAHFPHANGV